MGLYRDNGKENGSYYNGVVYWGYIGIMEKKMETTIRLELYTMEGLGLGGVGFRGVAFGV